MNTPTNSKTPPKPDLVDRAVALVGELLRKALEWCWSHRVGLMPVWVVAAQVGLSAYAFQQHLALPLMVVLALALVVGVAAAAYATKLTPPWPACVTALSVYSAVWISFASQLGVDYKPLPLFALIQVGLAGVGWGVFLRQNAPEEVPEPIALPAAPEPPPVEAAPVVEEPPPPPPPPKIFGVTWDEIAATAKLPGTKMTGYEEREPDQDYRITVQTLQGQTWRIVLEARHAIASVPRLPEGSVAVERDPTDITSCVVRLRKRNPLPLRVPFDPALAPRSVTGKLAIGVTEDNVPIRVPVLGRNSLTGGATGAGKSYTMHTRIANLVHCNDVLMIGIDLKGGVTFKPWKNCFHLVATTLEEAEMVLMAARYWVQVKMAAIPGGKQKWTPSPENPALGVLIDEVAEVTGKTGSKAACGHAEGFAALHRAAAGFGDFATQRPDLDAIGSARLRAQCLTNIALRVRDRLDGTFLLGDDGWNEVDATRLQREGAFYMRMDGKPVLYGQGYYLDDETDMPRLAAERAPHMAKVDALTEAAFTRILGDWYLANRNPLHARDRESGAVLLSSPVVAATVVEAVPLPKLPELPEPSMEPVDDEDPLLNETPEQTMQRIDDSLSSLKGLEAIPLDKARELIEARNAEIASGQVAAPTVESANASASQLLEAAFRQAQAPLPVSELTEAVARSRSWVHERLKRLKDRGVVTRIGHRQWSLADADQLNTALAEIEEEIASDLRQTRQAGDGA